MTFSAAIGIIGGSGLYEMPDLEIIETRSIETPFGKPSDALVLGQLKGIPVAFLARHGRGHKLLPTEIPYRANIYAFKSLGVKYLFSFSAVGSLTETFKPRDFVIPDQYIDITKFRQQSFFGDQMLAHVSMADPFCPALADIASKILSGISQDHPLNHHKGGTYLCIEGPQFSTQAESHLYRSWGAQLIGMTNVPEARLAMEAQMAYLTLAMVTDFDAWHPKEAHVAAHTALENLKHNAETALKVAHQLVIDVSQQEPTSKAHTALASSLITPVDALSSEKKSVLQVLLK